MLGVDGISDFNALHSRRHDHEVQLYAFDCLAYDGDDLSRLPLHLRETNLAQLLRGRAEGIFVAPFEKGEIGPELFEAACRMGLRAAPDGRRGASRRDRGLDGLDCRHLLCLREHVFCPPQIEQRARAAQQVDEERRVLAALDARS